MEDNIILPIISKDKTGWPWAEGSDPLPPHMLDGSHWPKVSIVTPSYNQAQYLEETIRSVLLQGYPNLEYIIIDGGSIDGSLEIIKKYEPWLSYWVSEPDLGQSDAINKGLAHATGEIFAWLNSDDTHQPDTIWQAVAAFNRHPQAVLVYGDCHLIDEEGRYLSTCHIKQSTQLELLLIDITIPQPSAFMRMYAVRRAGGLNPLLDYVMDYELWVRLTSIGPALHVPGLTANFRKHSMSKSLSLSVNFWIEHLKIIDGVCADMNLSNDLCAQIQQRLHLSAALEYLHARKINNFIDHFSTATASSWPYGSTRALARFMIDKKGLGGSSLADSPELVEACFQAITKLSDRKKMKKLKNALLSYLAMREVFIGWSQQDLARVRKHIWMGISKDPHWLLNRGIWSILVKSHCKGF